MAVSAGPTSLGFFLGIAGAQALGSSAQSTRLAVTAESSADRGGCASSYSVALTQAEVERICPFSNGPENRLATGVSPAKPTVLQSPSGLVTYPYEGADLARFARDILENEARIPNGRVVIDTQHWNSTADVEEDALRLIAEEFGKSICLKTNAAPYVVEFEPYVERERQAALGELAAARAIKKKKVEKIRVEHSITLETLKDTQKIGSWGADRIVLDGIQNHLKSDSGGTKVSITLKIGNRWYSRKQGLALAAKGRKVKAVKFSDNGRGYSYHKLGIDYSDKPNVAAGQFGRGLKQATASALLEGMEMEIFSQNWRAVPEWHEMIVDNEIVHKLCFDVEYTRGVRSRKGSQTIFYNPSQEFIDALSEVEWKVLYFRPKYKAVYADGAGNEIVDESGDIFVKDLYITSDYSNKLLFGYNLNTEEIPSDRNQIRERVIGNLIGEMIAKTKDKELIKEYLRNSIHHIEDDANHSMPAEAEYIPLEWSGGGMRWRKPAHPKLWRKAFAELFGERAVLETDASASITANVSGYEVYRCRHNNFRYFLANICGVPIDQKVGKTMDAFLLADIGDASQASGITFETSYTLSQRAAKWGPLRLILDPLSNHMPADSGGTEVKVHLKVPANPHGTAFKWVEWSPGFQADRIEEVMFADDGRGYDYGGLRYSFSDKPSDDAIGKHGEGLKMASATALRAKNTKIKFRSRDWVATPFASAPTRINESDQQVVHYRVIEKVDPMEKGSQTTIRGIDDKLKKIINRLDDFVLPLRDDQPYIHSLPDVRMFNERFLRGMPQGTVYNKGVFITHDYASRLLFSYDLKTEEISPDRDDVRIGALESAVEDAVISLTDRNAIGRILKAASDGSGREYMELIDAELDEDVAEVWKDVFYNDLDFGSDAVLFTSPHKAMEAMHKGFTVVKMNEKIARTLHAAGIEYDTEVMNEGLIYDEIPYDDLTPEEREMVESFRDIETVLDLPHFERVKIFSKVRTRTGRDMSGKTMGFFDGVTIHLNRRTLSLFAKATRFFIHERGHKETRASDSMDRFRNFFEYYVTAFVGKEIGRMREDPSYRVDVEAFSSSEQDRFMQLEVELQMLRAELEAEKKRADEAEAKLAGLSKDEE